LVVTKNLNGGRYSSRPGSSFDISIHGEGWNTEDIFCSAFCSNARALSGYRNIAHLDVT
jgi:hypothetical protein